MWLSVFWIVTGLFLVICICFFCKYIRRCKTNQETSQSSSIKTDAPVKVNIDPEKVNLDQEPKFHYPARASIKPEFEADKSENLFEEEHALINTPSNVAEPVIQYDELQEMENSQIVKFSAPIANSSLVDFAGTPPLDNQLFNDPKPGAQSYEVQKFVKPQSTGHASAVHSGVTLLIF